MTGCPVYARRVQKVDTLYVSVAAPGSNYPGICFSHVSETRDTYGHRLRTRVRRQWPYVSPVKDGN